jgi:hypothetical protein
MFDEKLRKPVENMTKNRNVSENDKSIETRGTNKKVTYADIGKNHEMSNDKIEVRKNK